MLLVYFSEALNELAAQHWRSFSSHQYFDSQGMFISLVFSTPLLVNCIIMVVSGKWSCSHACSMNQYTLYETRTTEHVDRTMLKWREKKMQSAFLLPVFSSQTLCSWWTQLVVLQGFADLKLVDCFLVLIGICCPI